MSHSYFVYFRLPSDQDKGTVPEANSRVWIEFDNGNALHRKKHPNLGDKFAIRSVEVQRQQSEFAVTQTEIYVPVRPRTDQTIPVWYKKLFNKE